MIDIDDEKSSHVIWFPKLKKNIRIVFGGNIGRFYDAETGDFIDHFSPFLGSGASASQVKKLMNELGYY
jgi:hypothetical protein